MKFAGLLEFGHEFSTAWIHIKNVEAPPRRDGKLLSLQLEIDEDEWIIRPYDHPHDGNEQIGLP